MSDAYTCECGATMAKRSSRRVGSLIERYLRCKVCDRRKTLLVQPEAVLKILLSSQQESAPEAAAKV